MTDYTRNKEIPNKNKVSDESRLVPEQKYAPCLCTCFCSSVQQVMNQLGWLEKQADRLYSIRITLWPPPRKQITLRNLTNYSSVADRAFQHCSFVCHHRGSVVRACSETFVWSLHLSFFWTLLCCSSMSWLETRACLSSVTLRDVCNPSLCREGGWNKTSCSEAVARDFPTSSLSFTCSSKTKTHLNGRLLHLGHRWLLNWVSLSYFVFVSVVHMSNTRCC